VYFPEEKKSLPHLSNRSVSEVQEKLQARTETQNLESEEQGYGDCIFSEIACSNDIKNFDYCYGVIIV
jgi:hypothetical protein